ncbi:MAG: hypothetical protein GY896_01825 [Gammaproteobacteria bacterium]|nr:hypothetical protein [Gammaproteobacteria bacterium]
MSFSAGFDYLRVRDRDRGTRVFQPSLEGFMPIRNRGRGLFMITPGTNSDLLALLFIAPTLFNQYAFKPAKATAGT